jgi:gamma-glutamylcyclotransferase (GGCT)/AIG2-like uncharacterized protein YtfP
MLREVMEALVGRAFEGRNATLRGYRRRLLRGEVYPAVTVDLRERTDGMLYAGLERSVLERLDRFEGPPYERRLLPVLLADGSTLDAFVYVLRPEHEALLSDGPWDEASFRAQHLRHYLAACRSFARAAVGATPPR